MKQSGHLNHCEETGTGFPITSKYGGTPPSKHGGVGRQQQHTTNGFMHLIYSAAMSDDQSDVDLPEEEVSPTMEYSAPICAVPPRVMLQEEGQVEVSASPAFQCLDDVSTTVGNYLQNVECE